MNIVRRADPHIRRQVHAGDTSVLADQDDNVDNRNASIRQVGSIMKRRFYGDPFPNVKALPEDVSEEEWTGYEVPTSTAVETTPEKQKESSQAITGRRSKKTSSTLSLRTARSQNDIFCSPPQLLSPVLRCPKRRDLPLFHGRDTPVPNFAFVRKRSTREKNSLQESYGSPPKQRRSNISANRRQKLLATQTNNPQSPQTAASVSPKASVQCTPRGFAPTPSLLGIPTLTIPLNPPKVRSACPTANSSCHPISDMTNISPIQEASFSTAFAPSPREKLQESLHNLPLTPHEAITSGPATRTRAQLKRKAMDLFNANGTKGTVAAGKASNPSKKMKDKENGAAVRTNAAKSWIKRGFEGMFSGQRKGRRCSRNAEECEDNKFLSVKPSENEAAKRRKYSAGN
ncbi:hypothetical protein Q1695_015550 [Nippostrongylus brasiliensis]|nr:hypothetical protein Q1695_015550 [Nippostrongylus brasiliensis]